MNEALKMSGQQHDDNQGERLARIEEALAYIRADLMTIPASIARLTEVAAVQQERFQSNQREQLQRDTEVNRRLDEFSKANVDNMAEHAAMLLQMKDMDRARAEGLTALKEDGVSIRQEIRVAKAQGKIWLIVAGAVWALMQFAAPHIGSVHIGAPK